MWQGSRVPARYLPTTVMQVISLDCFCVNKPYDNSELNDGSRASASAIPHQ